MALQLSLYHPVQVPASRVRILWQGFRTGDAAEASWTTQAGDQTWRGETNLPWLQRDAFVSGEEWKLNLAGVPAEVDSITLRLTSSLPGKVGLAILPLAGDPDDGLLHPGLEVSKEVPTAMLEFARTGQVWFAQAINTITEADVAEPAPSAAVATATEPGISSPGRAVSIPETLAPAVDRIRSAGGAVRRAQVSVVIDLSASMRPWLASGLVARVLTAIQAVAGASSRPFVTTLFSPSERTFDLDLDTPANGVLVEQIDRVGLRTGNAGHLQAAIGAAVSKGGLAFVVTDEPPRRQTTPVSPLLTIVLGSGDRAAAAATSTFRVVPEMTDITLLARDLALAAKGLDQGVIR